MMKRIIGNLVYDTDKAQEVHRVKTGESGVGPLEDTLYSTKRGNWFLVEESECFSEETGVDICAEFTALTAEEAFKWLMERQAVDAIQEYFADLVEEA